MSTPLVHFRDPRLSAQPCGCDPGANWECDQHRGRQMPLNIDADIYADGCRLPDTKKIQVFENVLKRLEQDSRELDSLNRFRKTGLASDTPKTPRGLFPNSAQGRKDHPVFMGCLMYFPDAIAAVAHVSKVGNDQHNPGQPLHWAREKSTDQMDTATRHMMDHGTGSVYDSDGEYHLAKAAWRILAELQLTIEKERGR